MLKIVDLIWGAQVAIDHHLFQGIEPMLVIVAPIILAAKRLRLLDLMS